MSAKIGIALLLWCASPTAVDAQAPPVEIPAVGPIPEASTDTMDYSSVAAALAALRANPAVKFEVKDGWTIATEAPTTLWSFPPEDHPAYPSAVKRELVRVGGGIDLHMNVKCEATKAPCDDLVRSFQALNQRMIQHLRDGR